LRSISKFPVLDFIAEGQIVTRSRSRMGELAGQAGVFPVRRFMASISCPALASSIR
jgi:hypothetical protein